jgi:hypothetical protein
VAGSSRLLQVQIKYFKDATLPELPDVDAIFVFFNGKAPI